MNLMKSAASFEEFVAPAVELNTLALNYTEKLVELSFAATRKQADVVLAAWREALAVNNPEAAQQYLARQGEVARSVVAGYVADAKAVNQLNQEVAADMRKVVETSLKKAA